MTIMIDGVGTDVPAILQRFDRLHPVQGYIWQPGVLPYIPWSAAQLKLFPGHMLTATRPGMPHDARWARELDVEKFDATADDGPPWLVARHDEFGHDDGQLYCDLSNLAGVLTKIVEAGLWEEPWWRLRIAWYWGRPVAPTLVQVMAAANSYLNGGQAPGVPTLEARRVWAVQWFAGGSYDLNEVFGTPDFTR